MSKVRIIGCSAVSVAIVVIAILFVRWTCTTYFKANGTYELIPNDDGKTATAVVHNLIGDTIHIDNVRMPVMTYGIIEDVVNESESHIHHKYHYSTYKIRLTTGRIIYHKIEHAERTVSQKVLVEEQYFPEYSIKVTFYH